MYRRLIVTFVVCLFACHSAQPPSAPRDLHETDEAVIAAVVRDVILKDERVTKTGVALIQDQSIGDALLRDYPPALNQDTERLYAAVLARNKTRAPVRCSACPPAAILVDAAQLEQHALAGDRQKYLDQIRSGAYATYSFHLPGYDGDLALVQYVWTAGELAMEGVWVLAKRSEDQWHIVEARRTWAA